MNRDELYGSARWARAEEIAAAGLHDPKGLYLALKALLEKPGGKPKRKHKPPDDPEDRRRLNLELAELKAQHWDWSREQLLTEAERRLFGRTPHRA